MKRILIDTNALISFVSDRNPHQNQLMYEILSGKDNLYIYIISNVISEFVYVMHKIYNIKPPKIANMITDLLKMPNVDFIEGYYPEIIFNIWPQKIADFGDSVITAVSVAMNIPIYTFDKKLSRQLRRLNCEHKLLSTK